MQQTRQAVAQNLAERMCGAGARRDDTGGARTGSRSWTACTSWTQGRRCMTSAMSCGCWV